MQIMWRKRWINHIISECSKLVQREYKTRHDWVWKVISREFCKKFKFDHTNKWYMHNPESIQENEMQKILWNFEIQTDHLLSARWLYLGIVNKKKKRTCWIVNSAIPADHRVKMKENKKKDKYLDFVENWKNYGIWKWWQYQL